MSPKLNPYLMFDGNAKEAMEFYQSVLGGELTMHNYGEAAPSEETKDKIMHANIETGDINIMASDDCMPDHNLIVGNNIHMSLVGTDEEKLTEYFNKLSKGGKVELALDKQPWGDIYGQFTDKFGIHWMVNISARHSETKHKD
jgi:PhnB protein